MVQPDGGVVARSRHVVVDCTLPRLAANGRRRTRRPGAGTMDTVSGGPARVARVNGPLVEVTGLTGMAMYDIIELGEHLLPGEAVAIRGDVTTVQAYDYTGGLAPGHPACDGDDSLCRNHGSPASSQSHLPHPRRRHLGRSGADPDAAGPCRRPGRGDPARRRGRGAPRHRGRGPGHPVPAPRSRTAGFPGSSRPWPK